MIFLLSLRNVFRNTRRLAPMVGTIVLIFALLLVGNAILDTTIDSLYTLYARNLSGDLTIAPADENNFTLFGSDQLLVGQFLVPPVLVGVPELEEHLAAMQEVRSVAGLVSSAARVELGKQKRESVVFGVDFGSYPQVVDGLRLEAGSFPEPGKPGVVLQSRTWQGAEKLIGSTVLLASSLGRTFTLREVPLTGLVSYPVSDPVLDSLVLTDADTARALNGYLYGSGPLAPLPEEDMDSLHSDFDDLFGAPSGNKKTSGTPSDSAVDPLALFSSPDSAGSPPVVEPAGGREEGAWNFLLVSLHNRRDLGTVLSSLSGAGYTREQGFVVRNWRDSIGAGAQLASFLQLLFNIGLLFISFGAVVIAANALLLSILERTGEIGTMRALGAGKMRIALMVSLETLMVVFAGALAGIVLGAIAISRLNAGRLIIDNPYIQILFGGDPIRGTLSLALVARHLAAALVLTILAMVYPLKRALGIKPVEAMAE
jgi:putative ABC transport system permease protein